MTARTEVSPETSEALVRVDRLSVAYRTAAGDVAAARDVSFEVAAGETLAVVGESGSGKSTVAGALLGHLRPGSRVTAGSVTVGGRDVFALGRRGLRELRGGTVALVGQNAGSALTPSMRVGSQVEEALIAHGMARGERRARVRELLAKVRLPDPDRIGRRYPHELSGGQQQRVAIAMAIAARPRVLVMDEPTTALDVLTQERILDLLAEIGAELDLATVLVSHDLGVVARMADRVAVMHEGEVVEAETAAALFANPAHPYTRRLLASVPRLDDRGLAEVGEDGTRGVRARRDLPEDTPELVTCEDVVIDYGGHRAVDGVSLKVRRGEVLALVGESGSGKSTLAWALAGLHRPTSGTLRIAGETAGEGEEGEKGEGASGGDLSMTARQRPLALRHRVQLAFQNADTSLNPRRIAREAVRRPLRFFGLAPAGEADARTRALIEDVQLAPALGDRLPQQLSGGQRQRIGIARALAGAPDVVVADEVTTALDVSVQASVLALLDELRTEHDLSYVFISHDLAVVREIADRVAVMRGGRIVEEGPTEAVFSGPNHPYTRTLLGAVLEPDPAGRSAGRSKTRPRENGLADLGGEGAQEGGEWIDLGGGHRIRRWDPENWDPENWDAENWDAESDAEAAAAANGGK